MASAAWLFAETAAHDGGPTAVLALRDALGRTWPVLDAICAAWCDGVRPPVPVLEGAMPVLDTAARVVVVGIEARWMDVLVARLPATMRIGLVRSSPLEPDWTRVVANHRGRVELLRLSEFQSWAGPRSVLMTFVYGRSGSQAFVLPSWLRVSGEDVRLQFRALLGWNILGVPMLVYPRWLSATEVAGFTDLVDGA